MCMASRAEASPLDADVFRLDILHVAFDSTGTNEFCWQCADSDPTNDLTGHLNLQAGDYIETYLTTSHTPPGFFFMGMNFAGTATNFEGLQERVLVYVRLSIWDLAHEEYPIPSVSEGVLTGFVEGRNIPSSVFIMRCCSGASNGVSIEYEGPERFLSHSTPTKLSSSSSVGRIARVSRARADHVVLLGSGLIGAEWKRRQTSWPPNAYALTLSRCRARVSREPRERFLCHRHHQVGDER